MKPLNGSYYVNIFSHYRPVGDPEWYQKPNPPGTPQPLIDIGNCMLNREHCADPTAEEPLCRPKVLCDKVNLPTLSPSMESIHGSGDLFRYWKQYKHKTPPPVSQHPNTVGTKPLKLREADHSEL